MSYLKWFLLTAVTLSGCGASQARSGPFAELDALRASSASLAPLAPQAFAHADAERQLAYHLHAQGDVQGAELHAARATAAYERARVLSRLNRATQELDDAKARRTEENEKLTRFTTGRKEAEQRVVSLQTQLDVASETLLPAASSPADPAREVARMNAATALCAQARLLCSSASLLAPAMEGLVAAEKAVSEVEMLINKPAPKGALIDSAARARANCLGMLTKARREKKTEGVGADALLSELSAAGGWDPVRDERGIVITLRDVFQGSTLSKTGETKLKELARVASAHPEYALQLVIHTSSASKQVEGDAQRAEVAAKTISSTGVTRLKTELVGSKLPLMDASDAKGRGRNARVEVVFVSPMN